jgi:hypothetical protein
MAVRGIVTALPACSPPDHILPEEDEVNGSDSRGQSPRPPTAASEGQERPARRRECRPRRTERAGQRAAEVRDERRRDDPPNQRCARHRGQGTSPGHAGDECNHRQRPGRPTRAARGVPTYPAGMPQILTYREYPGCSRM